MKLTYPRCYQLSLALFVISFIGSDAQEVEVPPVQIAEETEAIEAGEVEKATDALRQEVAVARKKLKDAMQLAKDAQGEERTRALADVKDAEEQLKTAIERDGDRKTNEKRGGMKEKSGAEEDGLNSDDPTNPDDVSKRSRDGAKGAEKNKSGEVRQPEGMEPDKREKLEKVQDGKDKERVERGDNKMEQPAAEVDQEPKGQEVSGNEPKMKPEITPEPEEVPEAIVESTPEAKEADQAVDRTTQQVEQEADRRKLNLKDEGEARKLIRDLIGSESEVSKAEAARETRLQPRSRGNGREARRTGNRDEIQIASDFLLQQLNGKATPEEAPAFFRRPDQTDIRRDPRGDRVEQRNSNTVFREQAQPRYYHEGRRYVRFDSRNSVPAILLAAAALDRVRLQPASQTDTYFRGDQRPDYYANELPPENFRGDDAVMVSYPVSKSSMISSNDIIFAQGSTRFADDHSYDMVLALADAMANPALNGSRFVIEGHASAEGSYEGNMALSQRRAEAIVRDMVREGIDPERLIPVGYGESEARYPADSPERLRSQDRNVRVFRTGAE